MTQKQKFLLLGWVTLIVFPAFGYLLLWVFEGKTIFEVLQPDLIARWSTVWGLTFGLGYGGFLLGLSKFQLFREPFNKQSDVIRSLNLSWFQMLFIAFCAGFGEEILFRVSIQTWLGPWLTTLLFIAIHGYFNIRSWKGNLPGILLFPFILGIAFGYELYGLWFCVAAHFAYDFLMLRSTNKEEQNAFQY